MVTSLDPNLLLSLYSSRTTGAGFAASTVAKRVAPTAPWSKIPSPEESAAQASASVKAALQGRAFINESDAQLDLPGASDDYRKLFALYKGLGALGDLAAHAQKKGLTSFEKQRLQQVFAKGYQEVSGYIKTASLDKLRLTGGEVAATAKTTAPVATSKTEYVTAPLHAGSSSEAVAAFAGNVQFTINVKRGGTLHAVNVDLNDLGGETRSLANVINHINGKLEAAGVDTRFASQRLPGEKRTVTVGGKTIDLGVGPDQFALKIKPNGETVNFSAASTANAVYVTQGAGDPNPDGKIDTNDGVQRQQFLKFQTDNVSVDPVPAPINEPNWVDGKAFTRTLGPEIKAVRASKTAADGSVYVLADVTNKTAGQAIKGAQDVALVKYDAAGNVVFSRTLGASDTASGLGLAVSADGKVAVAGSVTGGLNGATNGALNSGETGTFAKETDSFVTVFNADGEEVYTQRRGARLADEASHVSFGADGSVYVAGRAKSALPGASNLGDFDSYIEAFAPPDATGKVAVKFTQNFGTAAGDRPAGLVVDGSSVIVAAVENGRGVLRRYDVSGASPVLTSTRDLGDLQGGDITGLALDGGDVVVAGSTTNAGLNAGSVTRAHAGGVDAFAARLSSSLTPSGADAIAYYGGAGDDRATALAVSGGKVWIAGAAGTDLPDGKTDPVGKKDGFLASLNVGTGAIDWSRRFTGKDGYAAPTSIAVDPAGASALDRLGLPKGDLDLTDSKRLTAASSLRPGEQFTVRAGTGRPQTITIANDETLETLAQKIRRATGFQAKVTIGTSEGSRKLTIAPQNPRAVIEFGVGKEGKNALESLGIAEGVVRNTTVGARGVEPADGKGQIYGLSLDPELKLVSSVDIAHAAADLAVAQGVVRRAYRDLVAASQPPRPGQSGDAPGKAGGTVPTYLTNQISNYQAALARLGG